MTVNFEDEPKLEIAINEEGTGVEFSNDSGMPVEVWDSAESVILRSSTKSCITLASPLPTYTQGQVALSTPTRKILQVRFNHSLMSLISSCHHITHSSSFRK